MGKLLVAVARVLFLCTVGLLLPAIATSQPPPPPPPPELPPELQPTPLTFNVPATAEWVDTGLDVVAGDLLEVQAVGTWTDGGSTSGPEGSAEPWPDNFLNLTDLGACSVCARTLTEDHGSLIGYIGDSPPAAGSYTSTVVQSEAVKVFYIGANFRGNVPSDGRLWLNKNADAYSGYTLDNSGSVTATVTVTTEPTGSGQSPEITLLGSDPLQHTQGCPFVGAGAIASDAMGGDLTHAITITGTENLNNPGMQTLTYVVTDSRGLSATKTRQVLVFGVVGSAGCLSSQPAGKAPNLIVYVHGCCTDANDVDIRRTEFAAAYKGKASLQKYGGWEIVVWNWTKCTSDTNVECTPKHDYTREFWRLGPDAETAYKYAEKIEGQKLANIIKEYPKYKYIHLIAHSAGSHLIDLTAKRLIEHYKTINEKEKPFIYLTFLDAYTPNSIDREGIDSYGSLPGYTKYYAEHYVDKTTGGLSPTDADLMYAYNFDITYWVPDKDDRWLEFGHQWPVRWYIRSVEFPDRTGALGFKISLEGDYEAYSILSQRFLPGRSCRLTEVVTTSLCELKLHAPH